MRRLRCGRLPLGTLPAFLADHLVKRRSILALRRLAAFASDLLVKFRAVLRFHALAAAAACLANAHTTGLSGLLCHFRRSSLFGKYRVTLFPYKRSVNSGFPENLGSRA